MLQSLQELEVIQQPELKEILLECRNWSQMNEHDRYNSKLYKLTSQLCETGKYGNPTVYQVCDLVSVECAKRVSEKLSRK